MLIKTTREIYKENNNCYEWENEYGEVFSHYYFDSVNPDEKWIKVSDVERLIKTDIKKLIEIISESD